MENKKRRGDGQGCEDCPPCYNLVQEAVNQHRKELKELDDVSLLYKRNYNIDSLNKNNKENTICLIASIFK